MTAPAMAFAWSSGVIERVPQSAWFASSSVSSKEETSSPLPLMANFTAPTANSIDRAVPPSVRKPAATSEAAGQSPSRSVRIWGTSILTRSLLEPSRTLPKGYMAASRPSLRVRPVKEAVWPSGLIFSARKHSPRSHMGCVSLRTQRQSPFSQPVKVVSPVSPVK